MGSKLLRVFLTVGVVAFLAGTSLAQYSGAPFFTQPLIQSQAFGLETALQRLTALEVAGDGLDDDFMEVVEGLEDDLARFIGTLRAADPVLAAELEEAVEELEEAAEEGESLTEAIEEVREALLAAYDLIVPSAVRSAPAFIAGLIVDLSLGEVGVGEGYEEATEGELSAFTMGYVALARVNELWAELAPLATEQQRVDVEEMLEFIGTLYPTATIDEPIVGNPEEAEAPVHRIIGVLEAIVDAELYPGRNMAALAVRLTEEIVGACEAYEAGADELGREITISVGYRYLNADLGDFMEFMAPDTHEEIVELIVALTGLSGEDDDDAEAGDDDDDDDDDEEIEDRAAACRQLLEELEEARAVFGG